MGGNAFAAKGVQVARLDLKSYQYVCEYIMNSAAWVNLKVSIPTSVREKDSHGDVDVLVKCIDSGVFEATKFWRRDKVDVQHEYRNGPVISIAAKLPYSNLWPNDLIQIDLIQTRHEWHNFAHHYFSWNDAGNLYGRIAHRLGFKLGFDGLHYVLREDSHVVAELTITQDWREALSFIGFCPDKDEKGYDTYAQLFDTVIANPWYSPEIYLLENRNHVSRTRDAKRSTYNRFLEYIAAKRSPGFPWTPDNKTEIRAQFVDLARYRFPLFEHQFDRQLKKLERLKIVKQYFNGQMVADYTGLSGPELGQMIQRLKNLFPDSQGFEDFVIINREQALSRLLSRI